MRPSNWQVLGLSHDPIPGDPVAVRAGGTRYVGIADAIGRAAATMRTLEAGVSNVDSVKALLESRDKVVDSVGIAEGRYRAAGNALTAYATVLDRVQADTLRALHAAQAAAGDGADAARDQARYHQQVQDAKDAGDAEEQAKWEKKEDAAKADASHSSSVVAAQKQIVEQAVDDRDAAARTAIEAINSSTSSDGLNDSWWDDWGAKLTEWIAKVAEAIATIAGLLALIFCWVPILGEVLMVIAAVAGIVAALANIILAATGEKSWGEAIESVVFAALGCIGVGGALRALGGAAKAGLAFKGGVEAAAATKATGDAAAALGGAAKTAKTVTSGRTVLMESTDNFAIYTTKTAPKPGFHDVVVHGSPNDFGRTPFSWQKGENFDAKQLADILRSDPDYGGGPIRLLSCSTGKLPDGAAKQLANELGVTVEAPTDTLWAFSTGRLTIGPDAAANTGKFETFAADALPTPGQPGGVQ